MVDEASALADGTREPPDRKLLLILMAVVVLCGLPVIGLAFRPSAPTSATLSAGTGFADDFSRTELGPNYFSSGAYWRIVDGELLSPGAKNNPLWLRAALPQNVQVDFDARSASPDGDIRCELFGDGYTHASGYVFILGGSNNSVSAIARLDERGPSVAADLPDPPPNGGRVRVERRDLKIVPQQMYHWTIRREGQHLSWQLDGQPVLEVIDHHPLQGRGHDRFGFDTWDVDVFYDNLKITPL